MSRMAADYYPAFSEKEQRLRSVRERSARAKRRLAADREQLERLRAEKATLLRQVERIVWPNGRR